MDKQKPRPREHLVFNFDKLNSQHLGNTELIEQLLVSVSDIVVYPAELKNPAVFPVTSDFRKYGGHPYFVGIAIFGGYVIKIETVPARGLLSFSGYSERPWLEMEQKKLCDMVQQLFGASSPEAAEA
ncbi:MAG: hypothetical protein NT093_01245 [Candidatus Moranbacteria bacterium]|nr:hypothetical protein [Candidatus Moranbacteria bacterium]